MPRRWIVSPYIGTGQGKDDAYRPLALDLLEPLMGEGDKWAVANGPSNPDGSPAFSFSLMRAEASSFGVLDGVADVYTFPDGQMNKRLRTFPAQVRNEIKQALRDNGLDDSIVNSQTATLYDLFLFIGVELQGDDFDPGNMGD